MSGLVRVGVLTEDLPMCRVFLSRCSRNGRKLSGWQVDKDRSPKWARTLPEVSAEAVAAFFAPLEPSHPRGELQPLRLRNGCVTAA
eukprot:COSAG01_NODE_3692_length_5789_cov_4.628295_4_plen_86_part_00